MSEGRWFYNASVSICELAKKIPEDYASVRNKDGSLNYYKFRKVVLNGYVYTEVEKEGKLECSFEKGEEGLAPKRWSPSHNRIARGAIKNFCSSFNSSYSRLGKDSFEMKHKTKKDVRQTVVFEDTSYPAWIRKLTGYWKQGRTRTSLQDLLEKDDNPVTIVFDSQTNRYFLHLPVEATAKPEKQRFSIVSLDTGLRTFQTGYCPEGHVVEYAAGDSLKLLELLQKSDNHLSNFTKYGKRKFKRRQLKHLKKVKDLVAELHWKTICSLTTNYKTVLIPDFRIGRMVRGKALAKSVKRGLYMYSYYTFIQRLLWKGKLTGTKVEVVDESYTSKTCTACGNLHKELGSSKLFECPSCKVVIDRDYNGARNILLKNWEVVCGFRSGAL